MANAMSNSSITMAQAFLNVTLDCHGAELCINVPRPAVRGSTQILLTVFVPILTTAFKTLSMDASRTTLRRVLDFLLRMFFPELGLLRVQSEEVERSHYLEVLRGLGAGEVTSSQLMAIQQGKLHLARANDSSALASPTTPHGTFGRSNTSSLMLNSPKSEYMSSSVSFAEVAQITWCSKKPPKDSGFYQLDIKDVDGYKDILQSLPTGQKAILGTALPDSTTFILTLQLVWLIVTIALRLAHHYIPSILEIYCLFALTSFIVERVITLFTPPAWQQHVVYTTSRHFTPADDDGRRNSWKRILVIIPYILTISWPVYMMVYGLKGPNKNESFTAAICLASGGVHLSGIVWFGIAQWCADHKKSSVRWLRWLPKLIGFGAIILSRIMIICFGVWQAYYGQREIFLMPAKNWDIPHLTG